MAIVERLDYESLCLLECVEDPIFLTELMYNTAFGESNEELWPKDREFKLRSYQRDLISDRSTFISLTGGRAIGKCNTPTTRIYTDEGYKTISELLKVPSFNCYTLDDNGELTIKRGKTYYDKRTDVYKLETESGRYTECTNNHPFLTREGWKKLKDLKVGDEIAVATSLPELTNNNTFGWHELRWLGYTVLYKGLPEAPIKLRYKKQVAEFRLIAQKFDQDFKDHGDRTVSIHRKAGRGFVRNNISWFLRELGFNEGLRANNIRRFPVQIMRLPNEALKILLEAMFSQYASLSVTDVRISSPYYGLLRQIQEMLLRFGIESRIEDKSRLSLLDSYAIYRFYTTFSLPGVKVENIPLPPIRYQEKDHLRFETITNINLHKDTHTYAIYVYGHHNFIGDDIYQHNTLVLESKIIYNAVNAEIEYPVTREQLLATANQSQLNPVLDRIITRFSSTKFLRSFLNNQVNKSQGILKFPSTGLMLTARIAGSKGENNMIGLHLPKMIFDESQVFPLASFTQAMPALNSWEPGVQVILAGVPNGIRNSTLYMADQKWSKYKRYRIPSHNNPFYSRQDDTDNIKRFGGENSDEYQTLVLGRHGSAAVQILTSESITKQPFDFYNYRYTSVNKAKGESYDTVVERPKLPETVKEVYATMDCGFVDPSVIAVMGRDAKGVWRHYVRYKLQRIDFPEQERFVNWLDDFYHFSKISIDIGSGGNGASIMQGLASRDEYKHKQFAKRLLGFNSNESIVIGKDENTGFDIKKDSKSVATEELVRRIEDGNIIFSDIDVEGTSELERLAKQRGINGTDKYFILSDSGKGKSTSDHFYGALIPFALTIREFHGIKKKKLGKSFGIIK